MSKTIIISTDDMREIIKENFADTSAIDDYFCRCCYKKNNGRCPAGDSDCISRKTNEPIDFFIKHKFSNYMIPFS